MPWWIDSFRRPVDSCGCRVDRALDSRLPATTRASTRRRLFPRMHRLECYRNLYRFRRVGRRFLKLAQMFNAGGPFPLYRDSSPLYRPSCPQVPCRRSRSHVSVPEVPTRPLGVPEVPSPPDSFTGIPGISPRSRRSRPPLPSYIGNGRACGSVCVAHEALGEPQEGALVVLRLAVASPSSQWSNSVFSPYTSQPGWALRQSAIVSSDRWRKSGSSADAFGLRVRLGLGAATTTSLVGDEVAADHPQCGSPRSLSSIRRTKPGSSSALAILAISNLNRR